MAVLSTLADAFEFLIEPWLMIGISISYIPQTVVGLISSGNIGKLFSPSAFSETLFGNLWVTMGPQAKEGAQGVVVPLLEGKVSGGKVHDKVVSVPVYGKVLEVGAGSGMWADVLASIYTKEGGPAEGLRNRKGGSGNAKGITKIYGVEPNSKSAEALKNRVKEVGLGDVYEVVPVGIEDVGDPSKWDGKIEPESVDCIVGIRCMCSIPEPKKNIDALYKLLKPGGSWYVFEHAKTERGWPLMPLYQRKFSCRQKRFCIRAVTFGDGLC